MKLFPGFGAPYHLVGKCGLTTDWFQIRKGVSQGCILSPCLFNLYAEYIMWKAGLDEARAGIKIARRNINNLRYADDTTLMAESEKLKSLLMKVKAGGEGDNRGWDGWMASPTWVWANSGCWWWTGKTGVQQSMGSQRARHDWVTELNWTTET